MASDAGYTSEQLQKLEELFVECKFPNKKLIKEWRKDLKMDRDQIKSWFKNKRLLLQIEEKRQENKALRRENARIQWENMIMSNRLENLPKCHPCSANEIRESLLRENAQLREEYQRVTNMLVGILQSSAVDDQLQGEETEPNVDLELRLAPPSRDKSED